MAVTLNLLLNSWRTHNTNEDSNTFHGENQNNCKQDSSRGFGCIRWSTITEGDL